MRCSDSSAHAQVGCAACRDGNALGFNFTMAFQPIFDVHTQRPFAYEALVRGLNGESAAQVLSQVNDQNRYAFDQACRVKAIQRASELGLCELADCLLSINFLPNAVYRPETCIRATLKAAEEYQFPLERLMFEVTEGEQVESPEHLKNIFTEYAKRGFTTAIDDFGAGYSGLNLLARFQPHLIKLDMALTQDIAHDSVRQAIIEGICLVASKLNITIVAEGVETHSDWAVLQGYGIRYMQGYLFARPAIEHLAPWPTALSPVGLAT